MFVKQGPIFYTILWFSCFIYFIAPFLPLSFCIFYLCFNIYTQILFSCFLYLCGVSLFIFYPDILSVKHIELPLKSATQIHLPCLRDLRHVKVKIFHEYWIEEKRLKHQHIVIALIQFFVGAAASAENPRFPLPQPLRPALRPRQKPHCSS